MVDGERALETVDIISIRSISFSLVRYDIDWRPDFPPGFSRNVSWIEGKKGWEQHAEGHDTQPTGEIRQLATRTTIFKDTNPHRYKSRWRRNGRGLWGRVRGYVDLDGTVPTTPTATGSAPHRHGPQRRRSMLGRMVKASPSPLQQMFRKGVPFSTCPAEDEGPSYGLSPPSSPAIDPHLRYLSPFLAEDTLRDSRPLRHMFVLRDGGRTQEYEAATGSQVRHRRWTPPRCAPKQERTSHSREARTERGDWRKKTRVVSSERPLRGEKRPDAAVEKNEARGRLACKPRVIAMVSPKVPTKRRWMWYVHRHERGGKLDVNRDPVATWSSRNVVRCTPCFFHAEDADWRWMPTLLAGTIHGRERNHKTHVLQSG